MLALDEFQTISGDDRTPVAKLLMSLHEANTNLPVMLVLGGLGNTIDQANEIGLTRGLTSIGIGCLSGDETEGLFHDWCRHYGMNPQGYEHRINPLAASTEGWPRHVHFALQALAEDLVKPGVDGILDKVEWERVMTVNMQLRQGYYRACMSPQMEESAYLVGAVMRDLDPNSGIIGVRSLIQQHCTDQPGRQIPEGMTVNDLTRHLILRGALQKNADTGTIDCPIPSLRAWLVDQGEPISTSNPEPGNPSLS